MLTPLLTWLLTYAVHSTLLIGSAWAVCHLLGDRHLPAQEIILRVALVGGLITAGVQVTTGLQPRAGTVRLAAAGPTTQATASPAAINTEGTTSTPAGSLPPRTPSRWVASHWQSTLVGAWILGAALGILHLVGCARSLRTLLRDRRPVPPGRRLRALASAVGLRQRWRLSVCPRLVLPLATGVRRAEVCVPERVLYELPFDQRDALLAHELAHLARRDPAWLVLYRVVETVLFFQPMNRRVRRQLEQLAESLSDDRAVACTDRSTELARCLVEVGRWAAAAPRATLAVGAVSRGGDLSRRVNRLLTGAHRSCNTPRWLVVALLLSLAPAASTLPAVSPSSPSSAVGPGMAQAEPPEVKPDPPSVPPPPAPRQPSPAVVTEPQPPAAPSAPQPPAPQQAPSPPPPALPELKRLQRAVERLEREARRIAEEAARLAPEGDMSNAERRAHEQQVQALQERLRELAASISPRMNRARALRERSLELAEEHQSNREQHEQQRRQARELAGQAQEERRQELRRARELARQEAEAARRAAQERDREQER